MELPLMSATGLARSSLMQRAVLAWGALVGKSVRDPMWDEGGQTDRDDVARGARPRSAYSQVATVHACVNLRSQALARLPLRISTADDQVLESGHAAVLTYRPNSLQSGRAFWRSTMAMLDLFGRVHWRLIGDPRSILEVRILHPLLMQPRFNSQDELVGWVFRRRANAVTGEFLPVEEVHTIEAPDYDRPGEIGGLSRQRVAMLAIAQVFKSDLANESSLDNGVQPGGVFATDQILSDTVRDDFHRQVVEKHQGVLNRRRYMLLEGGIKFNGEAASFSDMEFKALKEASQHDICVAFDVPPSLLFQGGAGLGSGKEKGEDQELFWQRLMGVADMLAEEWETAVLSRQEADQSLTRKAFRPRRAVAREIHSKSHLVAKARGTAMGRQLYAWFDASGIEELQRGLLAQSQSAKTYWDMGVPLNDIVAAFDLPFEEQPWGARGYRPMGLIDAATDSILTGEPDGSEPIPPDMADGPGAGGDAAKSIDADQVVNKAPRFRLSEAQLARMWESWRMSWRPLEKALASKVSGHVMELRREVINRIEREAAVQKSFSGPLVVKDIIRDLLFDVVKANGSLLAKVRPLLQKAVELGGEQALQESAIAEGQTESKDIFSIRDPKAARALRRRETSIVGMNQTLQKRLRSKLAQAIEKGEGQAELLDAMRSEFNATTSRAQMIARTEIGAAVEEARQIGRERAGVPMKSWLWSRAEHGRRMHADTEAKYMDDPIPLGDDFVIAGTSVTCKHPRATGVAEHDINCGCTTISRYPDDQLKDARMLDHLVSKGFLGVEQLVTKAAGQEHDNV
jgi:HK97 family phage portal protein